MAKPERIQVRFPAWLKQRIQEVADRDGVSFGDAVVSLVESALAANAQDTHAIIIQQQDAITALSRRLDALEAKQS